MGFLTGHLNYRAVSHDGGIDNVRLVRGNFGDMDREEQERLVESSGLDWTIVKPPRLTDSRAQGRVLAGSSLRIGLLSKVSRASLTAFILDEIQTGRFVRQRIFVKG